jgi:hypothetical protein
VSPLDARQLERYAERGFVRLEGAFPRAVADEGRAILWRLAGCDPDERATWTRPVVRIGERSDAPFLAAAGAPRLRAALDRLAGAGRWQPRGSLGTFVVRFPGGAPGDDGWHVDASFPGDDPGDYLAWRINYRSRGRLLLMLFLFSDVGPDDAPTRLRVGSHHHVRRILELEGERGLAFMELAARLEATARCPVDLATGEAGTVYLCHPFLAHAAQAHHGTRPRFLAQPPLLPADRG